MQDVIEKEEEKNLMDQYTRRPAQRDEHRSKQSDDGYVVVGAPWSGPNTEDFPAFGGSNVSQKPPTWGPSTLGPKLPN